MVLLRIRKNFVLAMLLGSINSAASFSVGSPWGATAEMIREKMTFDTRRQNSGLDHYASSSSSNRRTMRSRLYSTETQHAKEVFEMIDEDGSGAICSDEFAEMLRMLDIDATDDDAEVLFRYLDEDGTGEISFEAFSPWYEDAAASTTANAETIQSALLGRSTVHEFDRTQVPDNVVRRAIECAIAAPNFRATEPWRFVQLGPESVSNVARLHADRMVASPGTKTDAFQEWSKIPGWMVVTTKNSPDNPALDTEDFATTSCAVQNFMLSMWAEGVGTKWLATDMTRSVEFANLCGIDMDKERVIGCIWYGFARGGLSNNVKTPRKRTLDDILSILP
eukprot:scaffold23884_cov58-Attheya_sp.AAC.1